MYDFLKDKNLSRKEKEDLLKEKWKELTISDDFLFQKVMGSNPEILKQLAELLIQKKVKNIVATEIDKKLTGVREGKHVRLDAYLQDEEKIINLEMQVVNQKNLPMRARYYGSLMDSDSLAKGTDYVFLPERYVVFICTFDAVGNESALNHYQQRNMRTGVPLGDGTYTIIYNTHGKMEDASPELKAFLQFVNGQSSQDPLVTKIQEQVVEIKNSNIWRTNFMKTQFDRIELYHICRKELEQELAEAQLQLQAERAEAQLQVQAERAEAARLQIQAEQRAQLEKEAAQRAQLQIQATARALLGTFSVEQIAEITKLSTEEILALQ